MRRTAAPGLVLLLALAAAACAGDEAGPRGAGHTTTRPEPVYEGTFTVLEAPDHGPQLCTEVLDSLPPQCGGLPVAGWDWARVADERSVGGTTWGEWHVTGTYDGGRFTLAGTPGRPERPSVPATDFSPACDAPSVVDPAQTLVDFAAVGEDIPGRVAVWVTDTGGAGSVANVVVRPGSAEAATGYVRARYGGPLCLVERDAPSAATLAGVQAEVTDAEARRHLGRVLGSWPDERRGVVGAEVWVADRAALDYARDRWHGLVDLTAALTPVS